MFRFFLLGPGGIEGRGGGEGACMMPSQFPPQGYVDCADNVAEVFELIVLLFVVPPHLEVGRFFLCPFRDNSLDILSDVHVHVK